jgi:hypothetical protein
VAERFKAPVLKTGDGQPSVSSNLTASAEGTEYRADLSGRTGTRRTWLMPNSAPVRQPGQGSESAEEAHLPKPKTVLLLGAGSSKPYGFPLGWELKRNIINMGRGFSKDEFDRLGIGRDGARALAEDFAASRLPSIDNFLALRDDYIDLGKKLIAFQLLTAEAQWRAASYAVGDDDHLGYLWSRLAQASWSELDFGWLTVVTFNYDRVLQQYLIKAMQPTYKVTEEQARDKVSQLNVIHVYGSLGNLFDEHDKTVEFGPTMISTPQVHRAAQSIELIPESRDTSRGVVEAQEALLVADVIGILGFGFDELNLRRLDAKRTLHRTAPVSQVATKDRRIHGSCLRMEAAAVAKLKGLLGLHDHMLGRADTFIDGDCLKTLKGSLILGEWSL